MEIKDKVYLQLQHAVNTLSLQELFDFMEQNFASFFSTPYISQYYQLLKDTDISMSKNITPKLIMAWLAFLSGDNACLYSIMKYINEAELCGQYESSMLYSLKAMAGFLTDRREGLKYAKLSLDILPEDDDSFYMANAKLTYGQLLASSDKFRQAAEMFSSSYDIFYSRGLHFLAAVALVNEMLNRYKLGEFSQVIDKCGEALFMSSSFLGEVQDYWDIVHMPLGMCYYEMNKPSLAIRHLNLAKESIDKMRLLHMHGLIEIYLFKSYYLMGDAEGMEGIVNKSIEKFGHMHYKRVDLIISMFKILSSGPDSYKKVQPDIESLEMEYMRDGTKCGNITLEALAYLKLKGLSSILTVQDIIKVIEDLRFIGFIPYIQLFLVYLGEIYCMEGNHKEGTACFKEAADLYKEHGISAAFFAVPIKSIDVFQKIDQNLYRMLGGKKQEVETTPHEALLSGREKDIMELIASGKSNEEISKTLYISVGTIKWHINHIFSKLEVKNRVQAIDKAKSLGEI